MSLSSLNVEVGAGDADLWLGDGPLRNLDIEVGAGKLMLDLVADWERDLAAEITSGVGQLTIYLPSDVGVIIDVEVGIAAVDARGLKKDGNTYTNDAYGESEVTLRLEIEGGVGDIRLEVRD
jgi:predicted membrane protein